MQIVFSIKKNQASSVIYRNKFCFADCVMIVFSFCFIFIMPTFSLYAQEPTITKQTINSIDILSIKSTTNTPFVALKFMFKLGSSDDPANYKGLANISAKVIAEGGTKTKSVNDIKKILYPIAGNISVLSDQETTTFSTLVHKDHAEKILTIMSELLTSPSIDTQTFSRIQTENLKNIESVIRNEDDEMLGKIFLEQTLFAEHSYQNPAGTVESIKNITKDLVASYIQKSFTKDRLLVGIAGNYSDTFISKVVKSLELLPEGNMGSAINDKKLASAKNIVGKNVFILEKNVPYLAISFGFPHSITRTNLVEFASLRLLASYLGEHRQSIGLLFNKIREERGLNYGNYSYIETFFQDYNTRMNTFNIPRTQQYFSTWLRPIPNEQAIFALRLAIKELESISKEGISQENFEKTKKFLISYSKSWDLTLSRQLSYAMDGVFYKSDLSLDEFRKVLQNLTLEQVNSISKKYLQVDNMNIVIVGSNTEQIKKQLTTKDDLKIIYKSQKSQPILDEDKIIEKYHLNIDEKNIKIIPASSVFER